MLLHGKPMGEEAAVLYSSSVALKKLKEKDYTKDSYKAVKNALKAAEKVLKDKKASQAKIIEDAKNDEE